MDVQKGWIRTDRLVIEFDKTSLTSQKPQRVKQYNMVSLPQKNQLSLIVCFLSSYS